MARGIRSRGSRGIPPGMRGEVDERDLLARARGGHAGDVLGHAIVERDVAAADHLGEQGCRGGRGHPSEFEPVVRVERARGTLVGSISSARRWGSIRTATAPRTRPATRRATWRGRRGSPRYLLPRCGARRPAWATRPISSGTAEAPAAPRLPYAIAAQGSSRRAFDDHPAPEFDDQHAGPKQRRPGAQDGQKRAQPTPGLRGRIRPPSYIGQLDARGGAVVELRPHWRDPAGAEPADPRDRVEVEDVGDELLARAPRTRPRGRRRGLAPQGRRRAPRFRSTT